MYLYVSMWHIYASISIWIYPESSSFAYLITVGFYVSLIICMCAWKLVCVYEYMLVIVSLWIISSIIYCHLSSFRCILLHFCNIWRSWWPTGFHGYSDSASFLILETLQLYVHAAVSVESKTNHMCTISSLLTKLSCKPITSISKVFILHSQ